jgi:hypothetical protein
MSFHITYGFYVIKYKFYGFYDIPYKLYGLYIYEIPHTLYWFYAIPHKFYGFYAIPHKLHGFFTILYKLYVFLAKTKTYNINLFLVVLTLFPVYFLYPLPLLQGYICPALFLPQLSVEGLSLILPRGDLVL